MSDSDLVKVIPQSLPREQAFELFEHICLRLALHVKTVNTYAEDELAIYLQRADLSERTRIREDFEVELMKWAESLLQNVWIACEEPGESGRPSIAHYINDDPSPSQRELPQLPPQDELTKVLTAVIFFLITTSKEYSSHTRIFLGGFQALDEHAVAVTLKNPNMALEAARKHVQYAKERAAEQGKFWRQVGIGSAVAAGGVLIGVTGGLGAPLVGLGVSTVLGWLGVGGTSAGLFAAGLASSSAVCGALFGAYGAKSAAQHIGRHVREVRDLDIIPVHTNTGTLAVRLCITGWLSSRDDVMAPWTIFDDAEDTLALQWEVEALEHLASAILSLIKAHALKYIKRELLKHTVLATLMSSLSPLAWLKLTQIIDNPWMNARALARKTGRVLGTLLAERAFGTRPVTLMGYSLGSLVILSALEYLATLPPSQSAHIVQDVFLFGTPAPIDANWGSARRVVAGRLLNGYSENDYILAILARISDATLNVAGLREVPVKGVENLRCDFVEGHLQWRGMVGRCLQLCNARGVVEDRVAKQVKEVAEPIKQEIEADLNEDGVM